MYHVIEAASENEATLLEQALLPADGDLIYEFVGDTMTLYMARHDPAGGVHLVSVQQITARDGMLMIKQNANPSGMSRVANVDEMAQLLREKMHEEFND